MSGLKRKQQELSEELKKISQEVKRLTRQRRAGGIAKIGPAMRNTARTLMVLRQGEPTAAVAFLKSKSKGDDNDTTNWEEEESALRAWWTSADDDTKNLHSKIGENNGQLHTAIKRARIFIVDEDLETWVAEQHVCKAISPVTAITLDEAKTVKHRVGIDATKTHKAALQWLKRWRGRRGLRLRKFSARDPMEKEELHGKANTQTVV